jgi:hypothetical protein
MSTIDKDEKRRRHLAMAYLMPVKKEEVTFDTERTWLKRGPYVTGDGDVTPAPRPGSLDFLACKSRGF